MTYKILKLVSDYVSGGVYVNRLELGDAGLGGPVDIRFIQEPGWIENTHSVFFSMNGKDYGSGDTGSLITTSDAGDLVFFDPSNEVGRTLTQLYSGGASLWTDNGTYVTLTTPRAIDLQYDSLIHVDEIIGGKSTADFRIAALYGKNIKLKTEAGYTTIEDVSVNAKFAPTQIDLYQHTVMNAKGIFGATTDGGDLNLHSTTHATKGRITLSGILDYSDGVNTHEIWMDGNDLKFKDGTGTGTKTLTQLATGAGAGLWTEDALNAWLTTKKDIDLQTESIYGVTELSGTTTQMLTVQSGTGQSLSLTADGGTVYVWDTTMSAKFAPAEIDFYRNLDMNGNNLVMGDGKVAGIAAGAASGEAVEFDQLAAYLPLAGGLMSGNIDMGGGVGSNDIVNLVRLRGRTANTLIIDFRGDDLNDIFYDTSSRLSYRAANKHVFSIGLDAICEVHTTGIELDAGLNFITDGGKVTGLVAATADGDAIAAGTDGYIPLANVPLGATGVKGDILVGTNAGCSTLYATVNNGHVLTLDNTETLGVKWAAGGGGGVADHGALTGLVPDDDHTQYLLASGARAVSGNLDMGGGVGSNDIVNVVRVSGRTTNTLILDFLGNDLNAMFYDSSSRLSYRAANMHVFSIGSDAICEIKTAGVELDTGLDVILDGGDILNCTNVKGQLTGIDGADRLNLDFRGDAYHRIYFTGISDNRLKYETASGHLFSINSADICQVHSAGINMASGKYIKSDSGDLELRAPSGAMIKFVIG